MSQNDYVIDNQTTPLFRADLNNALQALASNSSGATAPATTYSNMLWYDTASNILKMRSEADDAWINVGYIDQTAGAFRIFDDTQVVNTSGTQTGLIGDQTEATWETGTATTESLVSPAKVKAAIEALAPSTAAVGNGQSWAVVTRAMGTVYQNTTGAAIQVHVDISYSTTVDRATIELSSDGVNYVVIAGNRTFDDNVGNTLNSPPSATFIVPNNHRYFFRNGGGSPSVARCAILS